MAKNQLNFPVVAIDEASKTFERIAKAVSKLNDRLDKLDAKRGNEVVEKVVPDSKTVDKSEKSTSKLVGTLGKLGGVLGKLGSLGAAGAKLSLMGASAMAAAGQVAGLAAALAPAVGIIAGLPALLAVRGAAMATLAVGLHGVQEAFSSALTGNAEDFAKATERLSPNAKAAAGALRDMAPRLMELKNAVQDRLFAGFDKALKSMGETLAGPVQEGMSKAAGEMNKLGLGLAGVATEGPTVTFISGTFSVLSDMIARCREPLLALGRALVGVGQQGLSSIRGLGDGIAGTIGKFAEWLDKAVEAGKISEWIAKAVDVFRQLAAVASPLISIIGAIGGAATASGQSLLGTIGQLLQVVADFLETAEGMQFLDALFAGLGTIGDALGPVVQALGVGLAGILEPIGQIGAALGPGLAALITGLGEGLAALAPAAVPIAEAISGIAEAAAPILPILGKVLAVVAGVIAKILGAVDIGKIFDALEPSIQAILPALEIFGGILGEIGGAILGELAGALAELLPQVADLALMMIDSMLPVWEDMGSKIINLLPSIFDLVLALAGLLMPVLTQLLPVWMQLQAAIGGAVLDCLIALIPPLVQIVEAATPVLEIVIALASFLLKLAVGAISILIGWISDLIGWIGDLLGKFGAATAGVRKWARELAGKVKEAFEKVKEKLDKAVSWWKDLPSRIRRAVGDLGKLLREQGKKIIQGLIDGVQDKLESLKTVLTGVTNSIPFWKGPMQVDAKLLTPSGAAIMDGLMAGIAGRVPELQAQLGGITGVIGGPSTTAAMTAGVSGLAASYIPSSGGSSFSVDYARLAAAVADAIGPIVVAVDSREIARANNVGQRRLNRQGK